MARLFVLTSDQYLTAAAAPLTAVPWTFSCWAKLTTTGLQMVLMTIGDASNFQQFFRILVDSSGKPQLLVNDGTQASANHVSTMSTGVWYHVLGVNATTTSRYLWLNGVPSGQNTTLVTPSGLDQTRIASVSAASSQHLDGNLAEIGIWNTALSDAEIAVLAAGYAPPFVARANLVTYVPGIRDEDEDIVGGLSFTAVNSPTISAHTRIIYPAPKHLSFAAAAAPPAVGGPRLINQGLVSSWLVNGGLVA